MKTVFKNMDKDVNGLFETIAKATRPETTLARIKRQEDGWERLIATLDSGLDKLHHIKLELVSEQIQHLQTLMTVDMVDDINEFCYGEGVKNLHTNTIEISAFINQHGDMTAEQTAKSLFDIFLRRDYFNFIMKK